MSENNIKDDPLENSAVQEESFAEMLEKSGASTGWLNPGQRVRAKVSGISTDSVFIDLGGKSDGVAELSEFKGEDGTCSVRVGDEIEAFFIGTSDGVRKLTTLIHGFPAAGISAVRGAHEAGIPVTGDVKSQTKGGYEVSVGGLRCFCPHSHIDIKSGPDAVYTGQSFQFKVIEFKDNGRNIVLSRRLLLEDERRAQLEKLRETLEKGAEVKGTVRSIQGFGAFVDIGGAESLIPASEISWEREKKPVDVLSQGQEVVAKVIGLDWEKNRLTLSLKAMTPDPWLNVAEKYPEGSRISGAVVRLVPFGAFVSVEPGIDGLIHISNLGTGKRINHPKEVVEAGQWIEAYVIGVDTEKRKLSLSMQPKPEKVALPAVGEVFDGVVEKAMPFGVFLKLPSGLTGLIPNAEMGTPRGSDHSRMFPAGSAMQAVVIETDAKNGKVRLSRKAVIEQTEHQEFNDYMDSVKKKDAPNSIGTLGDKLKAQLKKLDL